MKSEKQSGFYFPISRGNSHLPGALYVEPGSRVTQFFTLEAHSWPTRFGNRATQPRFYAMDRPANRPPETPRRFSR